jgi:phosphinothricin acetyltransferase
VNERTAFDFVLRDARESDVPTITAIYGHEVAIESASWELDPPSETEILARYRSVTGHGYPYVVAVADHRVVGYAYASAYRPRPGYRYTVEDSVYIAPDARGRGVARTLLRYLINACSARGYRQMVAVIGGTEQAASIGLHRAEGFVEVGRLPDIGRKFDRWLASVLMQRALGDGSTTAPAVIGET